jgi:hypothetical protein
VIVIKVEPDRLFEPACRRGINRYVPFVQNKGREPVSWRGPKPVVIASPAAFTTSLTEAALPAGAVP